MRRATYLFTFAALLVIASTATAQQILFAKITSAPTTTSSQFVDIPGLVLHIPAASSTRTKALLILDVPQPFATGKDTPGTTFAIRVDGARVAEGGFTYSSKVPESTGRMPTTIVVAVVLGNLPQVVQAQWVSVRGSKNHIDSFASLSAVIGN
jgi:hypothetical protein